MQVTSFPQTLQMRTVNRSTIAFLSFFIALELPLAAQTSTRHAYPEQATRLVQDLAAGRFAAAEERFDSKMARELPEEKLSSVWKDLTTQSGQFQKVIANDLTIESDGYQVVTLLCAFDRNQEVNALISFDESGHIVGLYFGPKPTEEPPQWTPPMYIDAKRFHEISVTVSVGLWHLPGTLALPNSSGPFPVVVLVPGSPPLDQDATFGPNKLFKDLAWGLANSGVAVLRYTKRTHLTGAGLGAGQVSSFSLREELLNDADAALKTLDARSEIDHRHIYLLGHSLGGFAVPKLAAVSPQVAGIVVMGTPAGELLTALIMRAEAASEGRQPDQQTSTMIGVLKKLRSGDFASGETVELFGQTTVVSYWDSFRNFQPGTTVAGLRIPALILVGGHDAEVTHDDFDQWKRALAKRADDTAKLYPDVFHLFMPSASTKKGQDSPDDWTRPAHVTLEIVQDIASWILLHAKN
jgi:dienelactone hydrolase